jgi:serine/threonine transporter
MFARIWELWNGWSLILRILCGLIIGTVLAIVAPGLEWVEVLGTLFVSALKAIAPVLVLILVISALANAKKAHAMKTVILLYVASTFIAGLVAVAASFMFPVSLTLTDAIDQTAPSGIAEVIGNLLTNIVANPVSAITNANFLGILFWAVLLGLALRHAADTTKRFLIDLSDAVTIVVRWVIAFAPFGICGLVYTAVSTSGVGIFTEYGMLLAVLVGCMVFIALVTNPIIVFLATRENPYPLILRCLKDSAVTAFFTRSSAANVPVNLELCRKLGLHKDNYSVAIPLGATINMAGACVTISVMSLAAAHTIGLYVDFPTAVILCVLSAVSAAGASGVAGGSLLLIPLACSLLGVPMDVAMQVVGIGFIIGVVQDSCETALNSSSDVVFAATAEYRLWKREGRSVQMGKDVVAE